MAYWVNVYADTYTGTRVTIHKECHERLTRGRRHGPFQSEWEATTAAAVLSTQQITRCGTQWDRTQSLLTQECSAKPVGLLDASFIFL